MMAKWDFRQYPGMRPDIASRSGIVRINELTRKAVVFLGILDQSGAFAPYGTAFLVLWKQGGYFFWYIVTADHVLKDMKTANRPMVMRVNSKAGTASIGIIEDRHWQRHPTRSCDIAVASVRVSPDTFDVRVSIYRLEF
jgi:hypothetical protein